MKIKLYNSSELNIIGTAQKMRFSIKDFFSKWDQIHRKLRICSHLLKKSLVENLFVQCGCSTPHGVFLRLLVIALCINPYYFSVYLYQCLILLLQNTWKHLNKGNFDIKLLKSFFEGLSGTGCYLNAGSTSTINGIFQITKGF